ncbi:hypothetical protein [Nocardioides sp. SLBN-35]|uniref:hypothetical protein n=1 Tax=Nocardioides sp. SLBN-35 TaxID=2768445 RepID=UPI00115016F8|nr:hypothetical protein [Nocardioides sp. SLBN-35]TQK72629.1 hypothetical protein FBY23_4446 [Nocardioides sp. SLBN-35]
MGGAGLPWMVFGALAAVLAFAGILVMVPWVRAEMAREDELASRDRDVLGYEVPEGQDPTAILAALSLAGITAAPVLRHGRRLVLIDERGRRDSVVRRKARSVIAHAPLNTLGDPAPPHAVRFLDEPIEPDQPDRPEVAT